MTNAFYRNIAAVFSLLFVASLAQAQLALQIDTTAKTLSFTGTATGTPDAINPGNVGWTNGGTVTGDGNAYSLASVLSSAPETSGLPGLWFGDTGAGDTSVVIHFDFSSQSVETLTGAGPGTTFDYSVLTPAEQALVAALPGTLSLYAGTGFGAISVSGTAVPEPSTYAVFAGLGALGLVVVRRRRPAA